MRSLSMAHSVVPDVSQSDIVVINSCGVIGRTERKILKRVKTLKGMGKEVIMTGCLPAINPVAVRKAGVDLIAPIGDTQVLNELIARHVDQVGDMGKHDMEKFPLDGKNCIEVVKIASGCRGGCSYCATKNARGELRSRSIDSIVREVESALGAGKREIRLTAQDSAAYGMDNGASLPRLLRVISGISGEFRVRVGMMNPHSVQVILDDLVDAYDDEVIYKFLHLPLQSGDDEVLRNMNRGYTVEDFVRIVSAFRDRFDNITLSTDVIVGYPTETEESFRRSYDVIKEIKPDIVNITRFSARPGTKAYKLKDMLDRVKKERSRKMTNLHGSIGREINQKLIGKELKVLVTEPGKNGTLMGRTESYKTVVLRRGRVGEFKWVRIRDATSSYLVAE